MREVALGSMDVISLYPSIDQIEAAMVVAKEILAREFKYCGIDDKVIRLYLATEQGNDWQVKEGIYHILPSVVEARF